MACTTSVWWCGWGIIAGVVLIKCSVFGRSLLARSISDPSVLATRGAYVFIFSLCCLLSVCNVFTTPRAGPQSRPLPLVLFCTVLLYIPYYSHVLYYPVLYTTALPCTQMFCPILQYTVLYTTIIMNNNVISDNVMYFYRFFYNILYYTIPYCPIHNFTALSYTVKSCTALSCTQLYCHPFYCPDH